MSLVLYISWLFSDLEFWLELSMFVCGYYILAVKSYLVRSVNASVVAFLLFLSHSYVQGIGSFGLEDFGGVIVFFLVVFTLRSFGAYSFGGDASNHMILQSGPRSKTIAQKCLVLAVLRSQSM